MRSLVFYSGLLTAIGGSVFDTFRFLPDDFIVLVPEESLVLAPRDDLRDILLSLRNQSKTFQNDKEALGHVKSIDLTLHNRYEVLINILKRYIGKLSPEGQQFTLDQIYTIRAMRPVEGEKWNQTKIEDFARKAYSKFAVLPKSDQRLYNVKELSSEDEAVDFIVDYFDKIGTHMNRYAKLSIFNHASDVLKK